MSIISKIGSLLAVILWIAGVFGAPLTASAADCRDLFGVMWVGNAHDNLKFAKQMGYDCIAYEWPMETDPLAAGMKFFLQGPPETRDLFIKTGAAPQWWGGSAVDATKTYTPEVIQFDNSYYAWKSNAAFPDNLATGWFFTNTEHSIEPDWQQQAVIDLYINNSIALAKSLERPSIGFTFGGFTWDVPDLTGDFWSGPQDAAGQQVGLSYWTGSDSTLLHSGITHQYSTYTEGRAAMYKQLFSTMKQQFPQAITYMEPYFIYDLWIAKIKDRPDAAQLMPTVMSQEVNGTQFVDDSRIFASGLITKDRISISQAHSYDKPSNLLYAAKAAINGGWYNWYGCFGGEGGGLPEYNNIYEVPAWMQLIRRLPAWDNFAGVPLSSRSWNGTAYSSPNSYADANVIYSRNPKTGKIFVVFLNGSGAVTLRGAESVASIQKTDGFFIEAGDGMADVSISGSTVKLTNMANAGKGYIITTQGSTQNQPPTGVTIPGLMNGDPDRIVVEAYPGLLARTLIGGAVTRTTQKANRRPINLPPDAICYRRS